jgi:hypothetical protein
VSVQVVCIGEMNFCNILARKLQIEEATRGTMYRGGFEKYIYEKLSVVWIVSAKNVSRFCECCDERFELLKTLY